VTTIVEGIAEAFGRRAVVTEGQACRIATSFVVFFLPEFSEALHIQILILTIDLIKLFHSYLGLEQPVLIVLTFCTCIGSINRDDVLETLVGRLGHDHSLIEIIVVGVLALPVGQCVEVAGGRHVVPEGLLVLPAQHLPWLLQLWFIGIGVNGHNRLGLM